MKLRIAYHGIMMQTCCHVLAAIWDQVCFFGLGLICEATAMVASDVSASSLLQLTNLISCSIQRGGDRSVYLVIA